MRKNKNNKFTYAFGAAAAAVVYMVAPLPEAGAAIFKGSTTIKWNENETLKLDVELEADQIPTESLTTYSLADLSKFTSIKATLNHWEESLEDGVARRREITTDFFTLPNPDAFRVTVEDGNVTGFMWYDSLISDTGRTYVNLETASDYYFYSVPDPTFGGNMRLIDTSDPQLKTTFNGYPLSITHQKLKAVPAAGAEPNQPVPEPVPEPGFILGFITLASFMLGSRKKKEAKKT